MHRGSARLEMGMRSQLPHRERDSAAQGCANQLSTYGLTQAGCPVQTHPAIDPLVFKESGLVASDALSPPAIEVRMNCS